MTTRRAYALVAAGCALPRLAILLHERGAILADMEKSSTLAQVYLKTGTFGYIPGHPTAYTQPFYGWFLIVVYWIAGMHWWSVGGSQILVAVATSMVVLTIGRRFLSLRYAVLAALIATLQPYLIWHDIHGNREILDQLLGAGTFLLALAAGSRRSPALGVALGIVSGLAVLSNVRLVVLPLVLAVYLLWRRAGWLAAVAVPVLAALTLVPWVARNTVDVGCFGLTTDGRALWKANNADTYSTLSKGLWIDQVRDIPQRRGSHIADKWRTPEEAGAIYDSTGRVINVDECWQESYYTHLALSYIEHHPGGKAELAAQATWMLWDPRVGIEGAQNANLDPLRGYVEPLYTVPLYALAIAGLFFVSTPLRVLSLIFVVYETAGAWVTAGTTRYRVPWDFVLALLAAAALARVPWSRLPLLRRFSSQ